MKYFVENYKSLLDLKETEVAIKLVKDNFEKNLAKNLNLLRVSAPLFVLPSTGLNDNLNGYEKAVGFTLNETKTYLEVVQSLAKWKRFALKKYGFEVGSGLYTDMNAIRPFEELDNMHSCYVDQWDWEKVITKEQRNLDTLKATVKKIYAALRETEAVLAKAFPALQQDLPEDVKFISSFELEEMYPNLSRKERENAICEKYKAVFLTQIGCKLKDGEPHDGRAADYDDWALNGDLLLWYEPLKIGFELSSMGIRVDEDSIVTQCKEKNEEFKLELPYHQSIMKKELPYTIGGGIGQSRICMYMLKKVHIGEVQSSYWSDEDVEAFKKCNINLL